MKRRHYLIDDSSHPVFVTTTITEWVPVFSERELAIGALQLLENTRDRFQASFMAFVLMPSHFHGIIKTKNKGDLAKILKAWKALCARMIIDRSKSSYPEWLGIFQHAAQKYKRAAPMKFQVWQPRFDEFAIRTEEQFLVKLNYIHGNPVKHHLVEDAQDYPYSSIHDYLGKDNGYLKIEPLGANSLRSQ